MAEKWKDLTLKISVLLLGLFLVYMSSPIRIHILRSAGIGEVHLSAKYLQLETMFFFILAITNLLFIHGFFKNRRLSWNVTFTVLILIFFRNLHTVVVMGYLREVYFVFLLLELPLLWLMISERKNFFRKTRGFRLKGALLIFAALLILVLLESLILVILVKINHGQPLNFPEIVAKSVSIFFGDMDEITKTARHHVFYYYQKTLWVQALIVLLVGAAGILKPILQKPQTDDFERARELTLRYGRNPLAYLALESDKELFFGAECNGVAGYQVVNGIMILCGDIICPDEEADTFLSEILGYCQREGLSLLLLNTLPDYLSLYQSKGLSKIKCGEDACFLLSEYSLAGKKPARVRAAINHANKAGISVEEYIPEIRRDPDLESQINEISDRWLDSKHGLLIHFSVGGVNMDKPLDRRYFYSIQGKEVLGFVVFLPYDNGKAYMADVTRRREGAPQGVIEKIIYEAFMKMKEEGCIIGNMGLSPLYDVLGDEPGNLERSLNMAYEKLNGFYNFQSLHHAKEKFAPTHWEDRYFVYTKNINPVKLLAAMVRVQYPQPIWEIIRKSFAGRKGSAS